MVDVRSVDVKKLVSGFKSSVTGFEKLMPGSKKFDRTNSDRMVDVEKLMSGLTNFDDRIQDF
jgi:hypothetical protein